MRLLESVTPRKLRKRTLPARVARSDLPAGLTNPGRLVKALTLTCKHDESKLRQSGGSWGGAPLTYPHSFIANMRDEHAIRKSKGERNNGN